MLRLAMRFRGLLPRWNGGGVGRLADRCARVWDLRNAAFCEDDTPRPGGGAERHVGALEQRAQAGQRIIGSVAPGVTCTKSQSDPDRGLCGGQGGAGRGASGLVRCARGGLAAVRRSGRGGGSLLRGGAPLGAAALDEAEAPHALCGPVGGRGGKLEVDEVGAAARRSGVASVPDGAVAGEVGEELNHRDFRAVFGGEAGEAIGALSRATSTGDPDDDVGVAGENIRARHVKNITRTYGRVKVPGASAHAFAIEARRAETRQRLRSRERGPRLRGNALSPAVRPAAFGFAPRQNAADSPDKAHTRRVTPSEGVHWGTPAATT